MDAAVHYAISVAEHLLEAPTIHACIDNTGSLWCLRGTASDTSQDAFLEAQRRADDYTADYGAEVRFIWAPGHEGIFSNEVADSLVKQDAIEGLEEESATTRSYAKRVLNRNKQASLTH